MFNLFARSTQSVVSSSAVSTPTLCSSSLHTWINSTRCNNIQAVGIYNIRPQIFNQGSFQNNLILPQSQQVAHYRKQKFRMYKPNAYLRWKKYGYKKRTSTVHGLKCLWNRYLAGRNDLWH